MRAPPPSLLLLALFLSAAFAQAQTASIAKTPPAPSEPNRAPTGKVEPRIEQIRHEDISSRIDELRVGGETQNITVTPKNNMPAYQIAPETGNRNASATTRAGDTGARGWKVLGF